VRIGDRLSFSTARPGAAFHDRASPGKSEVRLGSRQPLARRRDVLVDVEEVVRVIGERSKMGLQHRRGQKADTRWSSRVRITWLLIPFVTNLVTERFRGTHEEERS
jgi:hypothetical protein